MYTFPSLCHTAIPHAPSVCVCGWVYVYMSMDICYCTNLQSHCHGECIGAFCDTLRHVTGAVN